MIYLKLFLSFLKIGAVSFGGGYGMISLVRETVLSNGWMTEAEFMDFIAVSESTPGPLAVNMATFIGSAKGGLPGAFAATCGVILPAFLIILLIASVMHNLLKKKGVSAALSGIRPAVAALILGTAVVMGVKQLVGISRIGDSVSFDFGKILILGVLFLIDFLYQKKTKKKVSPILLILIAAVFGIVVF